MLEESSLLTGFDNFFPEALPEKRILAALLNSSVEEWMTGSSMLGITLIYSKTETT